MRPHPGRGDADSHLWPCPQCGSANGLNALACWNCEAVLKPVPPEELPAPISASLAERGILERVADLRDADPPREMALATEGADEEDAWTAARTSDRWARAGRGADSRSGAADSIPASRSGAPDSIPPSRSGAPDSIPPSRSGAPDSIPPSRSAIAAPPMHGAERRAAPRPEPPADSPHHRSVEAFLALWTQPDDEPPQAAPSEPARGARPETAPIGRAESARGAQPKADSGRLESAHVGLAESAHVEAAESARVEPAESAHVELAESGHAEPAESAHAAPAESARVEPPAVDVRPQAVDQRAESAPAAEAAPISAPGGHPALETFEDPAPAGNDHPPIRIEPDDAPAEPRLFSFGPIDPPVSNGPDSDAFGPLPSARQESDPFHDAALGERFAELAESSARSARRRRRATLTVTGLLLAALAVVAYSIFEDGVRVDLSADELRSAAARSATGAPADGASATPTSPADAAKVAAEPAAPPVAALSPARPPSPPRTTAPVAVPERPSNAERAGRPTASVDAAPPAAPAPQPVAAARSPRTPPPAVIERFERSRPVADRAATAPDETPRGEALAATPAGGRAGETKSDDNTSITCTERILALGLCGPEPSRRKE